MIAKYLSRSLIAGLALCLACVALAQDADKPSEEQAEALATIRKALAGRDLPGAQAALREAKKLGQAAAGPGQSFEAQLARLDELANYYGQFWDSVRGALKGLANESELELKEGDFASVVEVKGDTLILRVAGSNRTYTPANMPAGLAILLSKRVLPKDVAANLVVIGTFAALDAGGDQEIARTYWEDATKLKVDISHLMPELDMPRELPPVELPDVTPMMKNLLSTKSWLLRYVKPNEGKPAKGAAAFLKGSIEKAAKNNDEGRLEIQIPDDAPADGQVHFKRPLSGNFLVRIVLAEVGEGQSIGLLAVDRDGEGWRQDLPKGTMQVEVSRNAGKVSIRIAGKTYKPAPLGNQAYAGPVFLTIGAPAGGRCTVAGIEFSAR